MIKPLRFLWMLTCLNRVWGVSTNCRSYELPRGSRSKLLLKSSRNEEKFWIKPGRDFGGFEIRLKVNNEFLITSSYEIEDGLNISASMIVQNVSDTEEINDEKLIKMIVKVFEKTRFGRDLLVLRAIVNNHSLDLDLGLWYTQYKFTSFSIYGKGKVKVYRGCHPFVETETVTKVPNITANITNETENDRSNGKKSEKIYLLIILFGIFTVFAFAAMVVILLLVFFRQKNRVSTIGDLGLSMRDLQDRNYDWGSRQIYENGSQIEGMIPPPIPPFPYAHNYDINSDSSKKIRHDSVGYEIPMKLGPKDSYGALNKGKENDYIDMTKKEMNSYNIACDNQ